MSKIIVAFIFTFSQLGLAKALDTPKGPKTTALELSVFAFSSARTVGEMLEIASILQPKENIIILKAFLKKRGVELKTPMPAVVLKKDKLRLDEILSFDVKDSSLWQNGANLKPRTRESFEEFLNRMEKTIQVNKKSKSASNWIQGILPYAYAESQKVDTAKEVARGIALGAYAGIGVAVSALLLVVATESAPIIAAVGLGAWAATVIVGALTGRFKANQKRKVACEPGELHLTTDGHVFKYRYDDSNKVKFPAHVTGPDGSVIKTITGANQSAIEAMIFLYREACILKKSTALNTQFERNMSEVLNTPGATGTIAQ